jgi:hypothetical protein
MRTYGRSKRDARFEGGRAARAERRAEKEARRARWQQMMAAATLRREQRDAIRKKLQERPEGFTDGYIAGFFDGQRFVKEGGVNRQQTGRQ